MAEIILQAKNLSKQYGDVTAVAGIDLPVQKGEVFGFLGPNGAGKTTTIGMVLGLIHPTTGHVEIFGERITPGRTAPLRRVGSLIGAPSLVPYLSGRDNLRLFARLYPEVEEKRVEEVLEMVGLTAAAGRKARKYSSGMKQRLGLAGALLHRPSLVILDEPTNGLDPSGMREVRHILRGLVDSGVTVFLSSHLLHEVQQICDRVAVLKQGRIVALGRVGELLGQRQVVRVRVPVAAAASEALQEITDSTVQIKTNGVYLEVSGIAGDEIVRHLAAREIFPSEVTPVGHDLEEIFLELTNTESA